MGGFRISIPGTGNPEGYLSDIPPVVRAFLKEGFSVLQRLYPTSRQKVLEVIEETVKSGFELEGKDIRPRLNISETESRQLLAALNFLGLYIASSTSEASIVSAVESMKEAELISDTEAPAVQDVLGTLVQHPSIKGDLETARLASALLPSLLSFDTTVDVRVRVRQNQVAMSVPVLIVHLDTDASDQEIWFQLSKRQVQKMIDEFTMALNQMEVAEKWAAQNGS